jgi:hypothetical protein
MFEKSRQTKNKADSFTREIGANSLYRNVLNYQCCLTSQNNEDLMYTSAEA